MPFYVVTGRLGGGKTLAMVGRIRDYIRAGKPVATNIALNLDKLLQAPPTAPVYRLPDVPTSADLAAIGRVHDTGDERKNGALVLDEAGVYLNARQWQDKDRGDVLQWFLHSRKFGWDVYLIVQSFNMLDKQLREALAEYVVFCRRLDRLRVPFVGKLGKRLTFGLWSGNMPAVHMAAVFYGYGQNAIKADSWVYRGQELYGAYQTVQRIGHEDAQGPHCLIKPATAAELARLAELRRRRPKPKRPEVAAVMGLPPEQRLAALRAASSLGSGILAAS